MTFSLPGAPIGAVAFDLDGLIANTEDLYEIAGARVLEQRGLEMNETLREQMIGRPAIVSLQLMIDAFALPDTAEALYTECEAMLQEMFATQLKAMPGLLDLLDALDRAGIAKVVATSGVRSYADRALGILELGDRFQFVLTAEDVTHGKPAPEIFELAARQLSVKPPQLMVLEDSSNGCQAAVAAGTYAVAVPNRHTRSHDFRGVRFVADTLADVRILLALRL